MIEEARYDLEDIWLMSLEAKRRLTEDHVDESGERCSFAPFLGGVRHRELGPIEGKYHPQYFSYQVGESQEWVWDLYELQEFELSEGETMKAYICTDRAIMSNKPKISGRYLTESDARYLLVCALVRYLEHDERINCIL